MGNRNPDIRRLNDAGSYDRRMRDPAAKRRKRANETNWRKANPELRAGQAARYYERNRAMILFLPRLKALLAAVVRAEEARGRFE